MNQKYHEFYRGEIYYADTSNIFAGSMAGMQPVLILLTDQGVYNSPSVIVADARRIVKASSLPTHVAVEDIGGLPGRSVFQLEAPHPIDKRRLRKKAGRLTPRQMEEVDAALRSVFYLDDGDYLPLEVGAP